MSEWGQLKRRAGIELTGVVLCGKAETTLAKRAMVPKTLNFILASAVGVG